MTTTAEDSRLKLPGKFWRLWWASTVDTVGDGAFAVAVPLLAVSLTRDSRLIAVVSAASFLPWLLVSLPVGAIVDRRDRTRLMWTSQVFQVVIVSVAAILIGLHRFDIAALAAVAFVLGVAEVVFGNASQAVLPEIVPKSLLHKANGYQSTTARVGQTFVGPPIGSFLFALSAVFAFWMNAASFAVSAAMLAGLTVSRRTTSVTHQPMTGAIKKGLSFLLRDRLLRTLAILLSVNTFCFQMGQVTLVLLATRVLHLSPRGYGIVLAVAAIGGILGGLTNARIVTRLGEFRAVVVSLTINALAFVAISASSDAVVLALSLAVSAFTTTLWSIATVTLRQQRVPNQLFGRVNSVYRMLGWGLMPLGALVGGFVAHGIGNRTPYAVAGIIRGLALLAALPALRSAIRTK
ncbi:MFS transporter [Flexivirga caeni]|uniref:MFS transporter n=1 Tax=Flexivirga caeni TaxID=2294115 RepID=A0A3M9MHH1_9MICO|nr:MFS transporter [Flexivirga caeni]RNI24597.1 MFS transporter [Flexivirga caeni]